MRFPVRIDRKVVVPMDDGTRVAVTLYLPDAPGDGPFPVVIESLPYRKDDDCFTRDHRTYTYLAARGIAGARVDVRGTGASSGVIEDEYVEQEQRDNVAAMGWLEAQDWCDGNIGMWGISWGGFSALQTAMLRPPQLRAIAVMHATHDRFACDVHYTGGSAHAAEQLDWPGSMVTTNALPPDPDIYGEGWREEWMRRLESTPQWPFEWFRHQRRDGYWLHGSPIADYSAIECPTLLVGGWLDGYVDGMLALAENLSCETRAIVGPWGHYRPATGVPGPTMDHFDLLHRWFGHHLRGDDNAVMDMPQATIFIRREPPFDGEVVTGVWRAEESWPPRDLADLAMTLSGMKHDATTWSGPQWVGSHAPFWDRGGFRTTDPDEDDAASMHFTSEPLASAIEILGTPRVHARVSTDRAFGLIACRLLAVDPGGGAHLVCRGNRNLAFPGDLSEPIAPVAGAPMDIEIPLRVTSAVIPAGWRVRLSLSGADFPVVWPPRDRFQLSLDPAASRLVLPVKTSSGADVVDIPTAGDLPSAPSRETRSRSDWELTRDGNRTIFNRVRGSTEIQSGRGELVYDTDQWWTVSVADDDPGTTEADTTSRVSLSRPGWDVVTEGRLTIRGRETFEVTVELEAWLDGTSIFSRRWHESIPREWA